MNEIIKIHEEIFTYLLEKNDADSNFRFGLRSKNEKNGRLNKWQELFANGKEITMKELFEFK